MKANLNVLLVAIVALFVLNGCDSSPGQLTGGDFDLVAASVTYRPTSVHVGDKVVIDHTVRNDGTNMVRGRTYRVDLYLDGSVIAFDHATSDLLPGASIPYSMASGYFTWQPTNAGPHRYRFVVDEENTVRERIETNNVIEGVIHVLP